MAPMTGQLSCVFVLSSNDLIPLSGPRSAPVTLEQDTDMFCFLSVEEWPARHEKGTRPWTSVYN